MSTKIDFQLNPDSRLDGKWLKTDLEVALKKNNVAHYWNELLKDGELVAQEYCSSKASTPDTDICGLANDVETGQFSAKKFKSDLTSVLLGNTASKKLIDSWTWSKNTDTQSVIECIKLLQKEQQLLCGVIAGNTISSCRLQQRVVVAYRYFLALRKQAIYQTAEQNKTWNEISNVENNSLLDHSFEIESNDTLPNSPSSDDQNNIYGLARVGTRTALSFAFAFLRRAWRSGEDCDICSELLLETLDALKVLPEALLFKERKLSMVWIDIMEKSSSFLRQVVLNELINSPEKVIPLLDRQYALQILFELAMQRGTVTAIIDMVLLLLAISEKNDNLPGNRYDKDENRYPLVPFLKRFQQVLRSTFHKLNDHDDQDIWSEKETEDLATCPTECFLRFLEFPSDENTSIDVKTAAVIIMAYLNRLIIPYLPTLSYLDNKKLNQMVFGWGWLPWESRNKSPLCQAAGELGVVKIILSDKYIFFISFDKKLYSYNYVGDLQGIEVVTGLNDKNIIDMASHPEGRHYMALTSEGTVYSWGNGEGGRLGHGDSNPQEYPTLIEALLGHTIVRIACGSTYSAAISTQGELFTWGRGNYGRLGHGTNDDANIPLIVEELKGVKITDVACGCGDAQTLAVTDTGMVYSWGDGDYGKLGRGGSEASKIPKLIESLCHVHVSRVYCGSQCSFALTADGEIYSWGKGDHFRLGHGTEEHLRFPKKIFGLKGLKVKKLAVGVTHAIALLDNGDVYAWGKKEYAHSSESEATGAIPELVVNIKSNNIVGVACGVTQSFAWSTLNHSKIGLRIPFVTDINENSINKLNKLLVTVCEGVTTVSDRPPSQEKECLIVSTFNILQLQLHAITVNNVDLNDLSLNVGSPLLNSIKQIVVDAAITSGVLDSIQSAAQAALQVGWSILLPTAEERAKALCSLMPTSDWNCNLSQGQHFMTDLLVSSLMADGGLEVSLYAAIKGEMSESIREEDTCPNSSSNYSPIPLLQLVKQLLRNGLSQTLSNLQLLKTIQNTERSPSLTLLIRFQRLLIAQIYQNKASESQYSWECDERNMGAESLFMKYLQHLINYICQVLNTATDVASRSNKHFYTVCNILKNTGVEILLPELLICLIMLHEEVPLLLHNIDWLDLFEPLFHSLEQFNRIMPHLEKEDDDEMCWPGANVSNNASTYKNPEDMPSVRKADVENHNKDGGFWIVHNNKVYDIQDSDGPGEMENLRKYFKGELSFKNDDLMTPSSDLLQSCCVGNYIDPDEDVSQPLEMTYTNSSMLDAQRTLSYLLGFHARCLSVGIPVLQTEKDVSGWLSAPFLKGGLTPVNPYEEKDEARSTNTTPTEPPVGTSCPYTADFQNPSNDSKLWDTVSAFDAYLSQNFKHQSLLSFNWNHPIEEVNRMLLAVLIKHLGLGPMVLECFKQDNNTKMPEHFEVIANVLHKTKLKLIQMKQEQNQSYKELCVPFLNKCRFLLNEVRPATSHEVNAIDHLQFLYAETRLKKTAKHVINCIKAQKQSQENIKKFPEKKNKQYYEEKSTKKSIKSDSSRKFVVNVKPGKPELIHAIVHFITEENTVDVELIRRAMCVQVERCNMRKQGYDLMLDLLKLPTVIASVKYNVMSGWLVTSPILNFNEIIILDSVVTPYEKIELLYSKYKVLQWTLNKLNKAVSQSDKSFRFCVSKEKNTCFSQRKLCWIRLVLSMIGLLSETSSGKELSFVINSGLFASIEYIFREADADPNNKMFLGDYFHIGTIFEEDYKTIRDRATRPTIPVTTGPGLSSYLRPGVRVVRGPHCKWENQVSTRIHEKDGSEGGEGTVISHVSSDGWVQVKWDSGVRNAYRMGKDGHYDLRLALSGNDFFDQSFDPEEENSKETESEKTKMKNPNDLLKRASIALLRILSLCTGVYSDNVQESSVRKVSHYLRFNLQERHKKKSDSNLRSQRDWATLGFIRTIARSKQICSALCAPSWLLLLFNIISGQNVEYTTTMSMQLQALRLLQTILPVGLKDVNSYTMVIKKLFHLLGSIGTLCYPDLALYNLVDHKPVVSLTASSTSTIIEEFVVLLRKLHSIPEWTDVFNSFMIAKLATAADLLSHPLVSLQNDGEMSEILFGSIASLLVFGGLDSRPRLGGYVIENGLRIGTICNIFSKSGTVMVQFHETNAIEQTTLKPLKTLSSPRFQLDKVPISDLFLDTWATLISMASLNHIKKHHLASVSIPLLRNQQQILSVIKAGRVLLNYQSRLRKVLKRPTLEPHMSLETLNETDNIDDARQSLLLHQLIINAVQPTSLNPIYTRRELEEAAINISQYLAVDFYAKQKSVLDNHTSNKNIDKPARCPSPPPTPLMTQLIEMGFSKKAVKIALKARNESDTEANIDQLVAWLLQYSEECQIVADCLTSMENNRETLNDSGTSTVMVPKRPDEPFKKRSDFADQNDYAVYVRSHATAGMLVRCCRSYDEEIYEGDIGVIVKINNGELHDLNLQVDWESKGYTYWVRFIHVELIDKQNIKPTIKVGDTVRVKPSVVHPQFKWGSITHSSVGIVKAVTQSNGQITVDFPTHAGWIGRISEMEVLPPHHQDISCNYCFMKPIIGDRFKCKTCESYNLCDSCFYSPHDHPHNFFRIVEPGSAGIFAGKPRKVERNGTLTILEPDVIEDTRACIKKIKTSSRENWAAHLLDTTSDNYWQSCGSQGRHWIRLEMCPNICIHRLKIRVDSSDTSYMPSLVKVYGGDSFSSMVELSAVHILANDTVVKLLSNVQEYYACIEIAIKMCQKGGIDCKIHAIYVTGKKRSTNDLPHNAGFLASDYNDIQDIVFPENHQVGVSPENKVFAWGLNDKDQLGGLKGSKVKYPCYAENLSALRPIHIAGGSKSLFVVSYNGKVYACGETTNGRLGLGTSSSSSVPRQLAALNRYIVRKVAVHSGGKHAMALTLSGKVFSWGEGDDGKLGHGNTLNLEKPKMIEYFKDKRIKEIACGSSYSAAITACGELYTWGLGEYGRLGHGDSITQNKPKLVRALLGKHIIKVACGSRDAQTLALDNEGMVYSWGDGDFGKLGRGGSEACDLPCNIEYLNGKGIIHVDCGAQFSLALTKSGQIWTWGKGDYYRLGLGTDQHVRKPTLVASLKGVHIVDVAVGALHCLAVSSNGLVYAWGDNDHGQQGNGSTMVNQKPTPVSNFDNTRINRVACGSSHSVAWQAYEPPGCRSVEPIPFDTINDPLGTNMLGISEPKKENSEGNEEISGMNSFPPPPSLSKQILSLESNVAKQTALQHVLNSLRVMYARDAVVAALSSSIKIESTIGEEKEDLDEMIASTTNVLSESSISTIARGGGEAPAAVIESSDELPSSSNMTTPDEVENPLNAFQSNTSSGSASYHMSVSRMSASTMSMIAATLKSNSQVIGVTDTDIVNLSILDDFTSLLGSNDARILVDLLKLAVTGRMGDIAKETLANVIKILASSDPSIAAMILEICVFELEDVAINNNILHALPCPMVQESTHPYSNQHITKGSVRIPGADMLRVEFDRRCSTERNRDTLSVFDPFRTKTHVMSGRNVDEWVPQVFIPGDEVRWKFLKDMQNNGWGWKFTVYPIMGKRRYGSDRDILSKPSIEVVMCLLYPCLIVDPPEGIVRRLIAALASCAQLTTLAAKERMWCLDKITEYIKSPLKKMLQMPTFLQTSILDSPLSNLMRALPRLLVKQYEYEDHLLKRGKQLLYSPFFKSIIALACELELDSQALCGETGKWSWFKHYCMARRVADALIHRTTIPKAFCLEVRKVIEHDPSFTREFSNDYENNELFTREHDEQLLMWLNRKPENWNLSWSGSGVIYGWGHNHRGQLGGVSGNQVKIPTPCEAFTSLRPVQLAGGEQSLFAITSEGRVYATGFADKGRLGIGDISHLNQANPFISTPMLLEPLTKVFIKKVAVHSGGKHCLALASNSYVFAWGDGEDGKLGLGHKRSCYSPTSIEFLKDKDIIDVACGGAHSAAITRSGKLYTWGRGRYGRLGHGSGEDQMIPKLVEALLGYHVTDVACGSGDAQTLCITSDDNVWSWGDGDYGKLGRGGADGCCIPLKIESLAGLGVTKVECGSQFSVALTRSGSVYTWGKGDYFRLGHGSDEHVRRPKKVAGLQGKKIVSIATGSLHVVVCTNKGEVFAWGDNDEGQIGDGTLKAVPRPRAIPALQDRNISLVVCGSAHTFAKSSDKPASRIHNMPAEVPLEYDLLKDLPLALIRNRLVLLHYFSDLLAPVVNMFPLDGDISLDKLRGILVYSAKESIFRKVLNATMAREPHHGPTIELNRIQVKKSRVKSGYAGPDGIRSVFGQMVMKSCLTKEALMLPHRVWKVQFVGESVDDYGGGYSESITEMCEELQNGSLPLLIPTPNGRDDTGTNRDCFILNPMAKSQLHLNMFNFLGVLIGIAIRTGSPLSLNLAEPVWKQLAGMPLTIADITEIDKDYIPGLLFIRDMNPGDKSLLDIPFSTTSASGHEVSLSSVHRKVTPNNKQDFIRLALNYRLHEFNEQVTAVRAGLAKVVPAPLLSLFSGYELETMVCGSPDIPLELLKSVAVYKGVLPTDELVEWFWEVMEEFSNQERSLFLRFVWGRTRLPRTIADFRGRDFVLQVMDKYNPPDHFLPESYTCFFLLKMPRYSDKFVLREKLKYAIYFCKSIDTDEYARIAIPGTGLTSSNSDSDGLESITGDETTPT